MTQPCRPRTSGATAVVLLLMLVGLAACSGDPKAPSTTAPEGFTVMSDDKEGFALAVPADWTRIPLSTDPDEFNKSANELRLANPRLASILNQARVLGQSGGKFMAVTPDGTGSVNLTVDKPQEKSLDEIVRNSIASLTGLGASNIAQEPGTLNGKPTVKLSFRFPVDTDAGVVQTDEVQYYLLENSKAYILSVLAAPPEVVSVMAASFRLR